MLVCPQCGERSDRAGTCSRDGTQFALTDDPFLGADVGSYRLVRLIGRGGMGRVYSAIHPALGARVAIKILSDEAMERSELVARFFNEARAVNMIRHEGIVNILDLLRLPTGRPAIIMEHLDGYTLREVIRRGPAPMGGVVHVMIDVLAALGAAHAVGIIHRDLKPDNIFITTTGRAKVLDFGVAKLAEGSAGDAHPTKSGAIIGTPHYMSPEQIGGGTVDARADIYAAGIVLFEAITGHLPFEGMGAFDLMRAHLDMPPPSPRELRPDVPIEIEHIILRALAKQRGQRFVTAYEMSTSLHHASSTLSSDQWRGLSPDQYLFPHVGHAQAMGDHAQRPPTAATGPMPDAHVKEHGTVDARALGSPNPPVMRPLFDDAPPTAPLPGMAGQRPDAPAYAPTQAAPGAAAPVRRRRSKVPLIAILAAATVGAGIAAIVMSIKTDPPSSPLPVAPVSTSPAPTSPAPPGPTTPTAPVDPDKADGVIHTAGPNQSFFDKISVDAHTFDPIAFIPTAATMAARYFPDPKLWVFHGGPVYPDGHIDLTEPVDAGSRTYTFANPSPEATRTPLGILCTAVVVVYVDKVMVVANRTPACPMKPTPATMRCSFAQAWRSIVGPSRWAAKGASVTWTRGFWIFDGKATGAGDEMLSGPDNCAGQVVATATPTAPPTTPAPTPAAASVVPAPSPAGPPHLSLPFTGDRFRFDPIAFIPEAQTIARRLASDATLIEVAAWPVTAQGAMDFAGRKPDSASTRYMFISPSRASGPSHELRGNDGTLRDVKNCLVLVQFDKQGTAIDAAIQTTTTCPGSAETLPRCNSATKVWAKGIAKGLKTDWPAWMHYEYGRWQMSGEIGHDRASFEFNDDC